MCAKFQLSRLIFIFIICQQLLSAVDSCSAVKIVLWYFDSHIGPKVFFPNFCLIGWLESVTATGHTTNQTDRCQVKIDLTPALLSWCQDLSWATYKMSLDWLLIINCSTQALKPGQAGQELALFSPGVRRCLVSNLWHHTIYLGFQSTNQAEIWHTNQL